MASSTDDANLVHQQDEYGPERDARGQSIAAKEEKGDAYPAKANSDQGAGNILHSDFPRKGNTAHVPEPEDFA